MEVESILEEKISEISLRALLRLLSSGLVLAFCWSVLTGTVLASPEKARIVTSIHKPVDCISPISVYNIDGQLVKENEMGFDLEPGKHSLVGTVSSFGDCPRMRTSAGQDVPPLEYDFDAGKTYYIGLQHKSANQQSWRFVVWRIEDGNGVGSDRVID